MEALEEADEVADEEANERVIVDPPFAEAEFPIPDELEDSLVVNGVEELDPKPDEVELALAIPPVNAVADKSLVDADAELECDVETVVATDTE